MKYYIISGEASGDLHGSNLIKELNKLDSEIDVRFWGGDLMQEAGGTLVKHYKELAFMGFTQVLMNIRTIFKNITFCKQDILDYKPDVLILIDYPGFNLRIAEFAKQNNIKVFYYISPQIWAWKQSRVHKIKKFVDEMFVILPFEQEFYKKFDVEVDFVGHPLLDAIEQNMEIPFNEEDFRKQHNLSDKPIVSLLAGSRKQEVSAKLPVMLSVVKHFPDYQFILAGAPSLGKEYYNTFLQNTDVNLILNKTYDLLKISDAALVTSGTATLETSLFEVPEVVCYRTNEIQYRLAKNLVKIKYISLVNLIMDDEIIKELIQHDLTENNLKQELNKLLFDTEYKSSLKSNYKKLKEKLGGVGASKRVAALIYSKM